MHVTSVIGKPPFVVMPSYRGVAEAWQAMQKSRYYFKHCNQTFRRVLTRVLMIMKALRRHMAASLGGATEWDDKYSSMGGRSGC